MRILTFGWEFPPHISGGLGTACYGLTKALQEENVSIIFVVPRAYGDEEIDLINASNIIIKNPAEASLKPETKKNHKEELKRVEVPSSITPYTESGIWEDSNDIKN